MTEIRMEIEETKTASGYPQLICKVGGAWFSAVAGGNAFDSEWTTDLDAIGFADRICAYVKNNHLEFFVVAASTGPVRTSLRTLPKTLKSVPDPEWVRINDVRQSMSWVWHSESKAATVNLIGDTYDRGHMGHLLSATASPELSSRTAEVLSALDAFPGSARFSAAAS